MDHGPKYKPETIKLLEENLCDFGLKSSYIWHQNQDT